MKNNNRLYTCVLFMTLSIFVLYRILRIYENFNNKIEIQTVSGSSPAITGIMKDINSVGNQMLADAEYDKVDERILNARNLK